MILTRSPSLLCFVTSSRVSFWSCLGSGMDIVGDSEGVEREGNVLYSPPHHEGRIHVILQTRRTQSRGCIRSSQHPVYYTDHGWTIARTSTSPIAPTSFLSLRSYYLLPHRLEVPQMGTAEYELLFLQPSPGVPTHHHPSTDPTPVPRE